MKIIEGQTNVKGKHFGVVVARFNDFITKRLLAGCLEELARLGVKSNQITVVWVPGSYEIPVVALKLARKKTIAAVICLGAVIRGETIHFDLVADNTAQGIREVALTTGKPIILGVLATETIQQAYERSDQKGDHKGSEAARNAVAMTTLLELI